MTCMQNQLYFYVLRKLRKMTNYYVELLRFLQ